MTHENDDYLLRLPQVRERVGLSTAAIYDFIARGTFPPPVKIGKAAVAWRASDIRQWIAERPTAHLNRVAVNEVA